MKIKTLLFAIFFIALTSCSSSLSVINKTDSTIKTLSILNKDEQSNLNLTFNAVTKKNVLKKNLEPNQTIKIKTKGYTSIIAITEDYDYHVQNNFKSKNVVIDKSNYNSSDRIVPTDFKPRKLKFQISNQSNYIIEKVTVKINHPLSNRIEEESVMNFWNAILPQQQGSIYYDYYGSTPYKIQEVTIHGSLNEKELKKRYIDNLDKVFVFKE